ncbi:LacI family transcriptional regulator [Pseudoroseicyclus aestuarii]|uniref:LacI family transcriptional regulator n=2 Tax=Pseudoroseicyclus aestuarii TaxID=1795041 RepID=A0A318SSH3_9RHOB|nr:LacI family transcriptional regulator [Pseudoroseicyclus aestuarii]
MILTGRPDTRLSPEAHQRVHAAAAELGYRPNVAARALRTARTKSFAFISDHVASTRFASGLVRGALSAAEEADHMLLLLETRGEPGREAQAIETALDRQVDGIVFASMRAREVSMPKIPPGLRAIMLNGTSQQCPTAVLPDEYEGGRAAVTLLAEAGVTEGIALLGHEPGAEKGLFRSQSVIRRLAGIRDEMAARGMAFEVELSAWNWEPQNGHTLTQRLLRRRTRPRALLCLNDRLAFGAYQALGEAALAIPEEVALVSFDDDEIAGYLRPGLTTIALPHEEMGARAVRYLLQETMEEVETLVPMQPIIRGSLPGAQE